MKPASIRRPPLAAFGGEAGRRIDAGSVTLHPNFMSLMSSW